MKKVLIYSVENDDDHRILTLTDSQYNLLSWLGEGDYLHHDIIFDVLTDRDNIDLTIKEE